MEIQITRVTSWNRAVNAARWTVDRNPIDKEPSEKFIKSVLMPQHSPIRLVEYDIKIKGIPYRYAVHFVRHHMGVEKFQATLRDDRNNLIEDSNKLPQDYPVNLWMACNADALIAISKRRLCSLASPTTRSIWQSVVEEMKKVDYIMSQFMVKECIYRGFCPESNSCKYYCSKEFETKVKEYRSLIGRN